MVQRRIDPNDMKTTTSQRLFLGPPGSFPEASTARSAHSRRSARPRCSSAVPPAPRIEDVDGNRFIDYVMSWGPLIHGHAPAGLVRAIAGAARHGTSFGAPSPLEHELGEHVRALMPSLERVRFVSSGTEAAMSAVRVARAFTGRDKIIKFEGCYHGHADAFLAKAGSGATTLGVPTSPGVSRAVAADTLLARYNDMASVESLCRKHKRLHRGSHRRADCRQHGRRAHRPTGFYKTFATCDSSRDSADFRRSYLGVPRCHQVEGKRLFGISPDLTCLGKIIGGGLPVGAYGGRADIMALVAPAGPVYQAGTLSGNPVAMTAGHWSLKKLTPDFTRTSPAVVRKLAAGLADAARASGVALQVNAFGSMVTPFFTSSPVRDYDSALTAEHRRVRDLLQRECSRAESTRRRRSSKRGSFRRPIPTATCSRRSTPRVRR